MTQTKPSQAIVKVLLVISLVLNLVLFTFGYIQKTALEQTREDNERLRSEAIQQKLMADEQRLKAVEAMKAGERALKACEETRNIALNTKRK